MIKENLPFGGSVDRRLATCAAEAFKPSTSSGASSEISPTSNPGKDCPTKSDFISLRPKGRHRFSVLTEWVAKEFEYGTHKYLVTNSAVKQKC